MRVKYIEYEDFINYYKPAMFIGTISCGGKCCLEVGIPMNVCQNDGWRKRAPVELDDDVICQRYLSNSLTNAIVFGGLEPFEQFDEMEKLIHILRYSYHCEDDIVIYTGYNKDEILEYVDRLQRVQNIVIKFGRFVPNSNQRFDEVLGIALASDNQFAERIS